ncbi:M48 family peptidase, partial [Burkholderia sp. AU32262]|nr:M48 family peptidase [Burkholderia sp. AU32262]
MRGNRLRRLARVAAALGVGAAALAAHATDTGATAAGSAPAAA